MYAIIECGAKQYKVKEGEKIKVERLPLKEGEEYIIEDVLLLREERVLWRGKAKIITEILRHGRGEKLRFYKFRRRKNYRRHYGHRQPFTELLIKKIVYDPNTN